MVKGPMYQVPLMAKLYSSLRKVSHLQLSLVIQVTRGGRKLPFGPLNCGERNPSQLYHCPPLVDSYLSTYCINTQREPKFFGGNAKERNRKDTVDCLLDEHFPPNLTSSLLHWPKTNRRPGIAPAKMGFSQSQQRITIWDLPPGWATCESPEHKGRNVLSQRRKGRWEAVVSKEPVSESSPRKKSLSSSHWAPLSSGALSWSPNSLQLRFQRINFFIAGRAHVSLLRVKISDIHFPSLSCTEDMGMWPTPSGGLGKGLSSSKNQWYVYENALLLHHLPDTWKMYPQNNLMRWLII